MSSVAYHPTLIKRHREIDLKILGEESRPLPDNIKLRELKIQKLRIKDQITSLKLM